MSSANSTEVEKTEDSSPVYEFEKSLSDSISKKFPNIEIVYVKQNRIRVNVKKEEIIDVASFIRDELRFDHAESVSGIDYPEDKQIEVVYHLGSYTDPLLSKQILALATRTQREDDPHPGNDNSKLPSLRDVFPSVSFHERECFEMLGVYSVSYTHLTLPTILLV